MPSAAEGAAPGGAQGSAPGPPPPRPATPRPNKGGGGGGAAPRSATTARASPHRPGPGRVGRAPHRGPHARPGPAWRRVGRKRRLHGRRPLGSPAPRLLPFTADPPPPPPPAGGGGGFLGPALRSSPGLRLALQREAPRRVGEDGKGGGARRRAEPRFGVRRARWGPGLNAAPPLRNRSPSRCGPPAAEGGRGAGGGFIPPGAAVRCEPPCPVGRGRTDPSGGRLGEAEPVLCPLPRDPAAERAKRFEIPR